MTANTKDRDRLVPTDPPDIVAIVEGELAELRRAGVQIVVDARRLVELESAGFVVDLQTGAIVDDPVLDVVRG